MAKYGNRICYFFYNVLFLMAFPILLGIQLFLLMRGGKKAVDTFCSRLALYPKLSNSKPVIWFHGASLGEVLSLIPLMKKLRSEYDHVQVLSVNTIRGEVVARQKSDAEKIIYLPLDFFGIVRRALTRIHPQMIIILETEIWPNLFWESARKNIPVVMVSGRISPKSFPRYYLARAFFSQVLSQGHFLMRTEKDAERLQKMGAPVEKIAVCGDIKYDGILTQISEDDIINFRRDFSGNKNIIVAGSTHSGEEKVLLEMFVKLRKRFPNTILILGPRHLKRLRDVTSLVASYSLQYCLRSQLPTKDNIEVIVLDTYGELSRLYWLANVVFVGGSLVAIGGHNVMEPAGLGKPVICGSYIFNFRRHAQGLQEQDAIIIVKTAEELEKAFGELLVDKDRAKSMGNRGREVVLENQGAIDRCVKFVMESFLIKNVA